MINPTPTEIEELIQLRLVGFNCRRYDNHIMYFTKRFKDILDIRIHIKHGDFDMVRDMFEGALAKYLDDTGKAKALAQAQTIANAEVQSKKRDNPDMTKAEIKKASQQALSKARNSVGAKRTSIDITDKEWEAIQAGAISENKLTQILNNTNIDVVRQKAKEVR